MEFSSNVAQLEGSVTIALAARVKQLIAQGHDIVDLTAGEPDFPTPAFIADAGIEAIRAGRTRYTAAAGIAELRAAIAHDVARTSTRPITPDPAGVVVTAGAKQALFNALFCLFGPGDRVLVPVPYWTSYPALVELARAEPAFVHGDAAHGFKVTTAELERAYHAANGARGLLLNSPANPTGAVYSHAELEAIARWAAERGVWLIADEIYRHIYHGGIAPGVLDLDPALLERVVVVDGASKAFAMTGWRLGFSYSAPVLAAKMAALQSQITTHAATPSQYAALAAYTASDEQRAAYGEMSAAFERRRELGIRLLREALPGLDFVEPEGAFYLFLRADGLGAPVAGSAAVCEWLLDAAGVALVPGIAFGDDRYVRASYACSEEVLREAVRRLATARDAARLGAAS